jgi:hypothetical protein
MKETWDNRNEKGEVVEEKGEKKNRRQKNKGGGEKR